MLVLSAALLQASQPASRCLRSRSPVAQTRLPWLLLRRCSRQHCQRLRTRRLLAGQLHPQVGWHACSHVPCKH